MEEMMLDMEKLAEDIVKWMKEKVAEANCRGLVFGMSGGIDSAVIGALAKRAFPETSLGIIMPCHSSDQDEMDARLVGDELGIELKKVDLTRTYDTLLESLDEDADGLAAANIKPRLRMTTLYYYAQSKQYLVAGSSNKSEIRVGYFTKHGDSGVDMLPIADLVKSEVYELAKHLGINEKIIDKAPSAGLWEGQTDEQEMGLTYRAIDRYIKTGLIDDYKDKEKIDRLYEISAHKRNFPPVYVKK